MIKESDVGVDDDVTTAAYKEQVTDKGRRDKGKQVHNNYN